MRGQELLAYALELLLRKRRTQRHVRHDWQSVGEPCDRHVEIDEVASEVLDVERLAPR